MTVKIIKCSNDILWYKDYIGETFKVLFETNTAYWLKTSVSNNAWVYKTDTKI